MPLHAGFNVTIFLNKGFRSGQLQKLFGGPLYAGLRMQPEFFQMILYYLPAKGNKFFNFCGIIWILCPIAYPIIKSLGFDLIWFSLMMVIGVMPGITPPFGLNLFCLKSIVSDDINMADIYRSVLPYIYIMILAMIILMIFSQIVLWLPDVVMKQPSAFLLVFFLTLISALHRVRNPYKRVILRACYIASGYFI